MKSTNYIDTFMEIAEDCPVETSEVPPVRDSGKTVANLEYELLSENPYQYSSDEVKFLVHTIRNNIPEKKFTEERKAYFSKSLACFRTSSLTKRYGWGLHYDSDGKMALVEFGSTAYKKFRRQKSLKQIRAHRSKRE